MTSRFPPKYTVMGRTMNILIVEDSQVDAVLLKHAVESIRGININIIHVCTIKEALTFRKNVDAVLLDLHLPDSTPDESISAISSFDCPLFVVSGNCDPIQASRAITLGAAGIVLKTSKFNEYVMWASCLIIKGYIAQQRKKYSRCIWVLLAVLIGILLCCAMVTL